MYSDTIRANVRVHAQQPDETLVGTETSTSSKTFSRLYSLARYTLKLRGMDKSPRQTFLQKFTHVQYEFHQATAENIYDKTERNRIVVYFWLGSAIN